jgi:hypothetical protein
MKTSLGSRSLQAAQGIILDQLIAGPKWPASPDQVRGKLFAGLSDDFPAAKKRQRERMPPGAAVPAAGHSGVHFTENRYTVVVL